MRAGYIIDIFDLSHVIILEHQACAILALKTPFNYSIVRNDLHANVSF